MHRDRRPKRHGNAFSASGTGRDAGGGWQNHDLRHLYRPSDFDPEKKYPVLEVHYPNPGYAWTPKDGFAGTVDKMLRAHAELGLITVAIDGRGTPGRSKTFYDNSYGFVASVSNIDDRVAGIQQLAERYPYMDTTRVGIIGHRGSGPVYALLERPDFYQVGINFTFQDMRLYFAYFPCDLRGWNPWLKARSVLRPSPG